jgi:hypothetical protein
MKLGRATTSENLRAKRGKWMLDFIISPGGIPYIPHLFLGFLAFIEIVIHGRRDMGV